MDDEQDYGTRSSAKKARVSSTTLEFTTASRSSATTTAPPPSISSSFRPRRRVPPDPIRYVKLWRGADDGDDPNSNNCHDKKGDDDDDDPYSSLSTILDELDLAEYHQRAWERIEELQRTIDECEKEIDQLRREIDVRTACLPRLVVDNDREDVRHWWYRVLPDQLKHDKEFAWALVRAAQNPSIFGARGLDYTYVDEDRLVEDYECGETSALPWPFQRMLWADEHCPLREDRRLLWASLDKGLGRYMDIYWTDQLENDRELLIQVFETCPWCLDHAGVPAWVLEDAEIVRTVARSPSLGTYRERLECSDEPVVSQFTLDLRKGPTLFVELVHQCVESKSTDTWARRIVEKYLPRLSELTSEDYLRLAVGVAEKMSSVPWEQYHQHCPLQYRHLPLNLKYSREFILAFIPVDASVTSEVPFTLRDDVQLWQTAVRSTPRYENVQVPNPSPQFPSKLFHLLLFEDAKVPGVITPLYIDSDAVASDRDFTMKYTCYLSQRGETWWDGHLRAASFDLDRDFWIDLAEVHRCHMLAWRWVPKPIQADPAVIRAWARHAEGMDPEWLASIDPKLDVLSDRQVLLNCLPPIWSEYHPHHDEHRQKIWRQVDPTILDYSLWLDLVSSCDNDRFGHLLPTEMKNEPAIVRARLRSTMKDANSFARLFCRILSLGVQLQHLDIFFEMLEGMDGEAFFASPLYKLLRTELLHAPELALAFLSKGWCIDHDEFRRVATSAPWCYDPDFLLKVAEQQLISAFRGCCPEILLTNKDVLLKVAQVDARVWELLDGQVDDGRICLKCDFDVLMSVLGTSPDAILSRIPPLDSESRRQHSCAFPIKIIVAFAREVRHRLTLHASIETVMMGTKIQGAYSVAAAAIPLTTPLSLLDRDRYTKGAFRGRLTALLGAPSSTDEASSLRFVSNALTRYGF